MKSIPRKIVPWNRKKGINRPRHYVLKKNRLLVLEANNHKCYLCKDEATLVHHIDGTITNHEPKNLLPLCEFCHKRVHLPHSRFDASYFKEYSEKMNIVGYDGGTTARKAKFVVYVPNKWYSKASIKAQLKGLTVAEYVWRTFLQDKFTEQ